MTSIPAAGAGTGGRSLRTVTSQSNRATTTSADDRIDPQLAAGLEVFSMLGFGGQGRRPMTAVDLADARRRVEQAVAEAVRHAAPTEGVLSQDVVVDGSASGSASVAPLVGRVHRPADGPRQLPVVCWIHGGGMTVGSPAMDDLPCRATAAAVGCVVVALPYRLAPEHRHPTQVEDCLAGLRWTVANHRELNVDPSRVALVGTSAGGGLAAATALLARDHGGPQIALQALVSPMLDDRGDTLSTIRFAQDLMWGRDDNQAAWRALLGEGHVDGEVPATAAPARLDDPTGLPPTLVQVAELEVLRDEGIEYARRLARAGVPVDLRVYDGAVHAWETVAPDAAISRRSIGHRMGALRAALGTS